MCRGKGTGETSPCLSEVIWNMQEQIKRALILNGELEAGLSLHSFAGAVENVLRKRGIENKTVLLREKEISDCKGCFHCWIKTPGKCIIDDYSREITRLFVHVDLAIFLTPLIFGGYSSELKKGLDRIIPLISPFFITIDGETHHRKRYKSYPSLIGIGITDQENPDQENIFSKLILRNSINMHSPFQGSLVFQADQNPQLVSSKLEALLEKVAGKRCKTRKRF